jgi:hypothetical protein
MGKITFFGNFIYKILFKEKSCRVILIEMKQNQVTSRIKLNGFQIMLELLVGFWD